MKTNERVRAARRLGGVALGAAGLMAAACGTTYQPRPSTRVSLVIHHGSARFVKNGQETAVGAFAGGLRGLVADTPRAAAEARTAHTQLMVGTPLYLSGVAAVIVGIVALGGPVGWVVVGAGAAVGGTGVGLMGAGFTHTVDAMNLHNDATVDAAHPAAVAPHPAAPPP